MMLGKYFKKTVFRKEHTADGVVPEAPQGILKKCNACKGAIFTEDVKRNLYICPKCGNYFRVHAYRRIEFLLDALPTGCSSPPITTIWPPSCAILTRMCRCFRSASART